MGDRLFGAGVVMVTQGELRSQDELFPEERQAVERALPMRVREFETGRRCARAALAALGCARAPVLVGTHREPVWPIGYVGSITHCPGFCAAAVARVDLIWEPETGSHPLPRWYAAGKAGPLPTRDLIWEPETGSHPLPRWYAAGEAGSLPTGTALPALRSLGLDAEPARPLPHGLGDLVCTSRESDWIASQRATQPWDRIFFSAKESAFKCIFPVQGRFLDYADLQIDLHPATGEFDVRVAGIELRGHFIVTPDLVLTAVTWSEGAACP